MYLLRNTFYRLMETAGNEGGSGGGDGGGGDQDTNRQALEQRALDMGWAPKDQWRGDASSWIDAPEFVQRGEQMLPILRSNLRKTETELATVRGELKKQSTMLQAANESIQVLTNLSTEQSRQAAKDRRRELLKQQAQARTDGNADLEIDLGEQIADMTSQINAAEEEAEDGAPPPTAKRKGGAKGKTATTTPPDDDSTNNPVQSPEYQAWERENPWFGKDKRKTALATAVAEELRADPANAGIVGKPFFDKVSAEVNKIFGGGTQRQTTSKVEGATNGGGGNNTSTARTASGKSYADLPADAKAACERQSSWVVGEGRAFKDITAWRKHYVEAYFNS